LNRVQFAIAQSNEGHFVYIFAARLKAAAEQLEIADYWIESRNFLLAHAV